jgi:hypothetical protein
MKNYRYIPILFTGLFASSCNDFPDELPDNRAQRRCTATKQSQPVQLDTKKMILTK